MKRMFLVWAAVFALAGCRRTDVRTFTAELPGATQADMPAIAKALLAFDGVSKPNQTEEMKKLFFDADRHNQEANHYYGIVMGCQNQISALMKRGLTQDSPDVRDLIRQAQDAQQRAISAQNQATSLSRKAQLLLQTLIETNSFDAAAHRLTVTYDSMKVAKKNLEMALAGIGFAANGVKPEEVPRKEK